MAGSASSGLGGAQPSVMKAVSEAHLEALVEGLEQSDHQKLEVAMRSSRVDAATTEGSADAPKVIEEHKGGGEGTFPQDDEDQMRLGIRIAQSDPRTRTRTRTRSIQGAHQEKIASLEQEILGLNLTCGEQRANVAALEKRNSILEVQLVESRQRSQHLAEENKKMIPRVDATTILTTSLSELDGVICELQSRIGQAIQSEDVSKLLHAAAILRSGLENSSTMQGHDVKEAEEEEDVDAVPLAVRKLDGELVTTVSWGQKLALARLKYIVAEKTGVPSPQVKLAWNGPEGKELTTNEDLFEAHANLKSMRERADAEATSPPAPAEVTLVVQKEPIDGRAFSKGARQQLSQANML